MESHGIPNPIWNPMESLWNPGIHVESRVREYVDPTIVPLVTKTQETAGKVRKKIGKKWIQNVES